MIGTTVDNVRELVLPRHVQADGELVVLEQGVAVPFAVVRLFIVRAEEGAVRGRHAHRACTQLLVCVQGVTDVECDDGRGKRHFVLDSGFKGLLIPPGIWASETYRDGAILCVLCDRPYESDDYVRVYEDFLGLRAGS